MVKLNNSSLAIIDRLHHRVTCIVILMSFGFVQHEPASADTLSIASLKGEYYAGEPLVLQVTLRLESPIPDQVFDSPVEKVRWDRKIGRRLSVELYNKNERLSSGVVGGGGFDIGNNRNDFQATVLVLLGTEVPGDKQSEFIIWNNRGTYEIILRDDSNLESNGETINLVQPSGELLEASRIWSSQGINTLLMLFDNEYGEDAQPAFEELCENYRQSTFGKYACATLALRNVHNWRYGRARSSHYWEI